MLVGNGLVGMCCLEDLFDMVLECYDVIVIGEEFWGNYNCIMLLLVLLGDKIIDDIMLYLYVWYSDKGICFIVGDFVVCIDCFCK